MAERGTKLRWNGLGGGDPASSRFRTISSAIHSLGGVRCGQHPGHHISGQSHSPCLSQKAVFTFRHCAYSLVSRFMHWCSGSSQQRDSRQLSSYALAQRAAIVCTQCDSRFVSAACTGGSNSYPCCTVSLHSLRGTQYLGTYFTMVQVLG